jgi:hypothetical protein
VAFDEAKYKDFLTAHRKDGSNPEDLLQRYAIVLPASDAEVKARVDAVRAYWRKTRSAPTGISSIAKWCWAQDEELRKKHGAALETAAWWQEAQQGNARQSAAAIEQLADSLKQAYGNLGVLTAVAVKNAGKPVGLSAAEAMQAAKRARLTVIDEKVTLPDEPPLSQVVLDGLGRDLDSCKVLSVPELLHPGSGTFKIVERYACVKDPNKRLDGAAIDDRFKEAGQSKGAVNNAKQDALRKLRDAAAKGGDLLDRVALFHLMSVVADSTSVLARDELIRRGVAKDDAATIAALLEGRQRAVRQSGADKVRDLLERGELREAASQAGNLPGEEAAEIQQLVAARQRELADLLTAADAALREPDEARAAQLLRDAARISREEAAPRLAQVPPTPAERLRANGEEEQVRLFWERGPGHDAETRYVVARTTGQAPKAPGDGTEVYRGPGTDCADPDAPVATEIRYGVFALADGRPASRAVTVAVTALPTVRDLKAEVGIGTVTLSWRASALAEVLVTRAAPGAEPVPVTVPAEAAGTGVRLTGLPEGVPQRFEVTAVYSGRGGARLAAHPKPVIAVPRGEAKPNRTLKVTMEQGTGGLVRVRASWSRIDTSEVTLLRSSAPLPWPEGETVTGEQASRAGEPVGGHVAIDGTAASTEFELPGGIHHLTLLSAGGNGTVVGKTQLVAAISPVTELAATAFTDHAVVSWAWPPSIELAEVSWQIGDDDQTADHRNLSRAQMQGQGGVRVPLGAQPCTVEVRSLITVDGRPRPSAPARITVNRVLKVPIRYRVSGVPFSRARKVTFTADEACAGAQVRMIAVSSSIMPTKPTDGTVVLDATLTLAPGVAAEHKVEVPKLKKPYWVRCFLVGGPGRLVDPPITELKEG